MYICYESRGETGKRTEGKGQVGDPREKYTHVHYKLYKIKKNRLKTISWVR